jgi:hypothetical protein
VTRFTQLSHYALGNVDTDEKKQDCRLGVGSSSQGPNFCPGQQLGSPECKLWVKDFILLNVRFNAPTSRLLALHSRHHKEIVMHRTLVLWDCATVVVRLGTMLIGVLGSRQIRLQLQAQIRTSTAMLTTVQPLQQGRIKLVLV